MCYIKLVKVGREILAVCSFHVYCTSLLQKVVYLQCRDVFGINSSAVLHCKVCL